MTRCSILLAGVAVVAGCASSTTATPAATASPYHIRGTFTLTADPSSSGVQGAWDSCSGTGGSTGFGPGMSVTVKDPQGNVVGTARTASLTSADASDSALGAVVSQVQKASLGAAQCVVKFDVGVNDAARYAVEVGGHGAVNYSKQDLEATGWFVRMQLANSG